MRLLLMAVLVLVAPASADVLILRDGSTVPIQGNWEIKNGTVIFTLPNGTLGSLRLRDVDLDASAVATAQANQPAAAEPAEPIVAPRAPVLTLTDEDVRRAPQDVLDSATKRLTNDGDESASEQSAPPTSTPAAAASADVRIDSWEESYSADEGGVQISGTLRNGGTVPATGIMVTVELYDEKGTRLADAPARVGDVALRAGGTTGFVATFPGVAVAGDVKFRVRHASLAFDRNPAAESTGTAGVAGEG